jgi:hypothetical protein
MDRLSSQSVPERRDRDLCRRRRTASGGGGHECGQRLQLGVVQARAEVRRHERLRVGVGDVVAGSTMLSRLSRRSASSVSRRCRWRRSRRSSDSGRSPGLRRALDRDARRRRPLRSAAWPPHGRRGVRAARTSKTALTGRPWGLESAFLALQLVWPTLDARAGLRLPVGALTSPPAGRRECSVCHKCCQGAVLSRVTLEDGARWAAAGIAEPGSAPAPVTSHSMECGAIGLTVSELAPPR